MAIVALTVAGFICWMFIISNVSRYFGNWIVYQWTLYKHPEDNICCCGSHIDDHSYYDNHSPKTQREWYIESSKPKFR